MSPLRKTPQVTHMEDDIAAFLEEIPMGPFREWQHLYILGERGCQVTSWRPQPVISRDRVKEGALGRRQKRLETFLYVTGSAIWSCPSPQ